MHFYLPLHMLMSLTHDYEIWGRDSSVIMATRMQAGLPGSIFDRMGLLFSLDKKNQLDVIFVFFISLLIVAQHVSGNHVPIIRS